MYKLEIFKFNFSVALILSTFYPIYSISEELNEIDSGVSPGIESGSDSKPKNVTKSKSASNKESISQKINNTKIADSRSEQELKNLTTITITADPRNPSLLEHSQPVSVLTGDDLNRKTQTSLGETLSLEPGLRSNYFGPAASRPVIRGNAGDRIRVLRNGTGSLDVSASGEDHQVTLNPLLSDSIEILRGPETLLYGSSAIGGVINVVDSSILSKNTGSDLSGEFNLRTETVDDELSGALKLEGDIGKFSWHLSGLSQDTNNINIPGYAESRALRESEEEHDEEHEQIRGTLLNSASRTLTGTIGTSYIWEKGFFGAALTSYSSRYGVPGHLHSHGAHEHHDEFDHNHNHSHESERDNHSPDLNGPIIVLDQIRLDTRAEVLDVSKNIEKIKLAGTISEYEHKEFEEEEIANKFLNRALETRAELMHAPIMGFSGTLGSQIEYSDLEASGSEAFLPSSKRLSPGWFLFEETPLDEQERISFQFGGRLETVHISTEENYRDRNFTPLSASTGFSWDILGNNKYMSGISVAYTERAPSSTELYADGIHFARGIAETGNDNLSNENSIGLDINFKKNRGLLTGGLSLFGQEYGNFIALNSSGELNDDYNIFRYEETRARFMGAELISTLHFHELFPLANHHLDLSFQMDYVRARDRKENRDLPRIPPLRTIVKLSYGWKETLHSHIEGVMVAAQTRTATDELPTDAYQMLNVGMDLVIPYLNNKNFTLYLKGNNLTNEEARVHSSFIKDLAPLPGRSLITGLKGIF
ncbi:MAG TPA: TonB-dependent receptor [Oligoflexia bacterium]|nr:TonB-dependent receptor [Oligoflexia bacterium]HMP47949.1 TonB-dependent receptor [Oligoflexia bacterium]